jgi:uncharacterized membrane protein
MTSIRKLVISGLMIALVFIGTFSIRIPVPFTQGYIHAGDSMIFLSAILFGWKTGALAGGIGSALADAMGYPHWIIPTLIIKALMGAIIGLLCENRSDMKFRMIQGGLVGLLICLTTALRIYIPRLSANAVLSANDELSSISEASSLIQNATTNFLYILLFLVLSFMLFMIFKKKQHSTLISINHYIAMIISGSFMVFGYYLAASLMYGSFVTPLFSIPSNVFQFTIGGGLALILIVLIDKTHGIDRLKSFCN